MYATNPRSAAIAALQRCAHECGRLPAPVHWTIATHVPDETAIERLFGSFQKALVYAGITRSAEDQVTSSEQASREPHTVRVSIAALHRELTGHTGITDSTTRPGHPDTAPIPQPVARGQTKPRRAPLPPRAEAIAALIRCARDCQLLPTQSHWSAAHHEPDSHTMIRLFASFTMARATAGVHAIPPPEPEDSRITFFFHCSRCPGPGVVRRTDGWRCAHCANQP